MLVSYEASLGFNVAFVDFVFFFSRSRRDRGVPAFLAIFVLFEMTGGSLAQNGRNVDTRAGTIP